MGKGKAVGGARYGKGGLGGIKNSEESLSVWENIAALPDGMWEGDARYLYHVGKVMKENTVFVETDGPGVSAVYPLFAGLRDGGGWGTTLYTVESEGERREYDPYVADGAAKPPVSPISRTEALYFFAEGSIDVLFFRGEKRGQDVYDGLCLWYPKLKQNGWLFGRGSLEEGREATVEALEGFAVERRLGFTMLKYPLTDDMFEIYGEATADGLREVGKLIEEGRFFDALSIMKKLVASYPYSPFLANLEAEITYRCGRFYEAEVMMEGIVRRWPHHVNTLNNMAAMAANRGNFINARAFLGRVTVLDPDNETARCTLAAIEGR